MGKSPINSTEFCYPSPGEGKKTKTDVSSAFSQKKGYKSNDQGASADTSKLSEVKPSSKPDSWVKGGGSGKFEGPDDRRKHSFGK